MAVTPVSEQIPEGIEALAGVNAIDPNILKTLQKEHEAVLDALHPNRHMSSVIHGDAHPGNIIRSWRGDVWLDFEESCYGPVEWDLACLWRTRRANGPGIVNEFLREIDWPTTSEEQLAPCLRARELEATVWLLGLAYQRPEQYQQPATETLDGLLTKIQA